MYWSLIGSQLRFYDCINQPKEYMVLRRVLTQGLEVDRGKLLDTSIEPNQWLS